MAGPRLTLKNTSFCYCFLYKTFNELLAVHWMNPPIKVCIDCCVQGVWYIKECTKKIALNWIFSGEKKIFQFSRQKMLCSGKVTESLGRLRGEIMGSRALLSKESKLNEMMHLIYSTSQLSKCKFFFLNVRMYHYQVRFSEAEVQNSAFYCLLTSTPENPSLEF